ncbi:MAG: D-glycero-beta-D-manno-heptose 1-phosphate adenylyltransferase [Candidatus Marinimicrobia bacterium]|jgi:D-beta-D-heptose 7-phosphate kinase/D-beta-D-heptose 1-phosphate adenosyltransferase|nr:D-glycero-beta-D-manno-heptose 1-phosphate adenylyltransferase [Candidatus Neomarinimicrobiota bacterium]MDP6610918.1 D-glycero-beta-D-manno-heptose 1-phosphate adenylyltransferase [Candidatus Neomarinimicrobiota bacterium]|tara:strand:- start:83 stop:553 length:471 start_codon:yes stop_codon:yes gene_type:complete
MTLFSRSGAKDKITQLKAAGKKVVFTNGCFDILHRGHTTYLRQARALGDFLIVGLNSDESVGKLKGSDRPINNEMDRGEVLMLLDSVDAVVIFNEETPEELIHELLPDLLVKGGDYKRDEIVGALEVESQGGKVVILPYLEGYSTTEMIQKERKKS